RQACVACAGARRGRRSSTTSSRSTPTRSGASWRWGRARSSRSSPWRKVHMARSKSKDRRKEAEPSEPASLTKKGYDRELRRLQVELLQLEEWIRHEGLRVVVIFEGRDTAGKGGMIKRITTLLNPRFVRVVALPAPTERERTQWYFQRYVVHLPAAGEMVLFDRSWYNRAGVERVMGFCTQGEY